MTTMYSFYQKFSDPVPSDEYWSSLVALACAGLSYLRRAQTCLVWDVWD